MGCEEDAIMFVGHHIKFAISRLAVAFVAVGLAGSTMLSAAPKSPSADTLEQKVRHELVMLPRLNLFDDLSFRVDGSTVTLLGEVTQPILQSEAGNAVKNIEGVTR